jgi:hypothetical protein
MKNSDYSASLQLIVQEIIDESKLSPKQDVELRMVQSTLDYLIAIEAAIESGKCNRLDRLLKNQVPIHPKLLPALADCLKAIQHGTQSGRPSIYTPTEDEVIHTELTHRRELNESTIGEEIDRMSDELGAKDGTIRRIWNRFQQKQKKSKRAKTP